MPFWTVRRAVPSSQNSTSPQASAAASDRLRPPSAITPMIARSTAARARAAAGVSMHPPRPRRGRRVVSRIRAYCSQLVVAGDGGIGKSTLLVSTLLAIAGRQESELGPLRGSIFEGVPGSVLYAAHEDRAAVVASLARWGVASGPWGNAGDEARGEALARFHVLPMRARSVWTGGRTCGKPPPLSGPWLSSWTPPYPPRPLPSTQRRIVFGLCPAYLGLSSRQVPLQRRPRHTLT